MTVFSLMRLNAHRSLAIMLSYRLSATFIVVFGTLFAGAEVISLLVYYQYTPDIAGWDFYSFLSLVASYGLIQHLYQFLFIQAHEELMGKILDGELDYDLVRPIDSLVLCSLRNLDYPSLINLAVPISLLGYSWPHLSVTLSTGTIVGYVTLIVLGVILYYLLNQFFVSLAFWVDRPQKLAGVTEYLFEFASRPRSVYPQAIQVLLSFVLPLLTAVNAPADLLRGHLDKAGLIPLISFLVVLGVVVRLQWWAGTRRYASANG